MYTDRLHAVVMVALFVFFPLTAQQSIPTISWGMSSRQGLRNHMEDTFTYKALKLPNLTQQAIYFGLFDGHGGDTASMYAANRAADEFQHSYSFLSTDRLDLKEIIFNSFNSSYIAMDKGIQCAGTTALTVLICEEKLYVAWAGDSRALLVKNDGAISLQSLDHKPDRPEEKKRIDALGEVIVTPLNRPARLGGLAVSRALGDALIKSYLKAGSILPNPEFIHGSLEEGDTLILATDGLWDVLSSEDVAQIVVSLKNSAPVKKQGVDLDDESSDGPNFLPESAFEQSDGESTETGQSLRIARILREEAFALGSSDNISVVVILIS